MRQARGGPRARGVSRPSRSADNSGDESINNANNNSTSNTTRKAARKSVRFQDVTADAAGQTGAQRATTTNRAATPRKPTTSTSRTAAASTTSPRNPASAPLAGQRNASARLRRGTSTQRANNNAVSQAARDPSALSRSFGSAPTANAPTPSTSSSGQQSFQQRYQTLKRKRDSERQDAIANGFLADPDKPRTLAEAITPVGTCPDMCPEFERVERVVQNDVWSAELEPENVYSNHRQQPDEGRMVKKFRRAAAGIDEQLPSDLRPPYVLQKTIDYLFNDLIEQSDSLASVHHFVWDRTRAIRNDFSIQQVTKVPELRIAIDCYERIARFHILSLHLLALPEKPYDKYDAQQEREQLDKTLLSLMQYYDDSRGRLDSPNEAEFRAYCVIFQIQDPIPDLEDRVQTWPERIAKDPRVQRALRLYAAACNVDDVQGPLKPLASQPIAQANWARFWKLVGSSELSYLMSCVAEIYFPLVRRIALSAIWTAFRAAKRTIEDWTLEQLMPVFGFEDTSEVEDFCVQFGFNINEREDGLAYLDLESVSGRELPDPAPAARKQSKSDLVERKRYNRFSSAVISGMSVRAAKEAGMIEEPSYQDEEMDGGEQSLFITDHSDEEDTQNQQDQNGQVNGSHTSNAHSSVMNPFAPAFAPSNASAGSGNPFATSNFGQTTGESGSFAQQAPPSQTQTVPSSSNLFNSFPSNKAAFGQNGFAGFTQTSQHTQSSDQSNNPTLAATTTDEGAKSAQNTTPALFTRPASTSGNGQPSLFSSTTFPDASSTAAAASDRPFSFLSGNPSSKSETPRPTAPSLFQRPQPNIQHSKEPSSKDAEAIATSSSEPERSLFDRISDGSSLSVSSSSQFQNSGTSIHTSSQFQPPPSSSFTFPSTSQAQQPPTSLFANPPTTSTPPSTPLFSAPSTSKATHDSQPPSSALFQFPTTAQNNHSLKPPEQSATSAQSTSSLRPISQPVQPVQPPIKSQQQIQKEKAEEEAKKSATLDELARRLITDSSGLLDQYIEFTVIPMIQKARQQVADEKDRQEADEFRLHKILRRYGLKWREICWGRRIARAGRERRQRMAKEKEAKAKRERDYSISANLEAFKKSQNESTTNRTSAALAEPEEVSTLGKRPSPEQDNVEQEKRQRMSDETSLRRSQNNTLSQSAHRRSGSVPNRSAILESPPTSRFGSSLRPSALRQSFLPENVAFGHPPSGSTSTPRSDTTRSTYFRLKALGIDPSGLSRSTDRKRPRSSDSHLPTSASPGKRTLTAAEATSPVRQTPPSQRNQETVSESQQKQAANDEDEDLFAAVRQAREAMSESISFFHEEIAKEEEMRKSRGSDASPPGNSPPNAGASSRASTYSSVRAGTTSTSAQGRAKDAPPAYRSRVSRFLPRERYADVQMRRQSPLQNQDQPDSRTATQAKNSGGHSRAAPSFAPELANAVYSQPASSPFEALSRQPAQGSTEQLRPPSKDSMFTPDGSFASSSNIRSSFASPPQPKQSPLKDSAISHQTGTPEGYYMTNGINEPDQPTPTQSFAQVQSLPQSKSPNKGKEVVMLLDDDEEEDATDLDEPQAEFSEIGVLSGSYAASNHQKNQQTQEEQPGDAGDGDTEDDADSDGFEAEAATSDPHRHNSFALLNSMGTEDGDDSEDSLDDEDDFDSERDFDDEAEENGDQFGQQERFDHDGMEGDEEEDGEDDGEEYNYEKAEREGYLPTLTGGNMGWPNAAHAPAPMPKPTINGKSGASVEDAIEL